MIPIAEINPPLALQNLGAVHTAEVMRTAIGGLIAGRLASASLKPRGGVVHDLGGSLAVTQTGSPSMGVSVASGVVYIPGSQSTAQGAYAACNDAAKTVSIAASHATLNRIDLIVAKVEDSFYSGAVDSWSLSAVTGTPASSPAVPAAPANSITLSRVAVNAAVTTITNANITDVRPFAAGLGGVIPCTSTNLPTTSQLSQGQILYYQDTDRFKFYDGTAIQELEAGITTPTVVARRVANQSIPDNVSTFITFDTQEFDNCSGYAAPSTTITIPSLGVYSIVATGSFAINATGVRFLDIIVNGNRESGSYHFTAGSGTPAALSASLLKRCTAGDTIQVSVYQNSGGALNLFGSGWFAARLGVTKVATE